MRPFWLVLGAALLAGAVAVGSRRSEAPPRKPPARSAPAAVAPREAPETPPETATAALPPNPIDLQARLAKFEGDEIGALEEELEARLSEDPAFAETVFAAFLAERDPVKMSFLQNAIASNPHLRNSPEWQDRFLKVAEGDGARERRIGALLFVQQAETIRPVHDRMLALAERDPEVQAHALVALKGLPERRLPDPRLVELAGRLADSSRDPEIRGLAVRLEDNPERAARALSDPEAAVRAQAAQVVTSREALQKALAAEKDPDAKAVLERRLESLP